MERIEKQEFDKRRRKAILRAFYKYMIGTAFLTVLQLAIGGLITAHAISVFTPITYGSGLVIFCAIWFTGRAVKS